MHHHDSTLLASLPDYRHRPYHRHAIVFSVHAVLPTTAIAVCLCCTLEPLYQCAKLRFLSFLPWFRKQRTATSNPSSDQKFHFNSHRMGHIHARKPLAPYACKTSIPVLKDMSQTAKQPRSPHPSKPQTPDSRRPDLRLRVCMTITSCKHTTS